MNKSRLSETLAQKMNLSVKKSEEVVTTVFYSMSEALIRGERIELRGFGTFFVKDYKPYLGRNPKTGMAIHVKPKKLPFFKVGKELKQRVNM